MSTYKPVELGKSVYSQIDTRLERWLYRQLSDPLRTHLYRQFDNQIDNQFYNRINQICRQLRDQLIK